jgi:lipoprotein-releasing system permease protein
MTLEHFIARRHVHAIRKKRRVSMTSRIASVGIGIGVASLVVVLSVMNGFSGLLWERLLSLSPHVTIRSSSDPDLSIAESELQTVREIPGVSGAAAYIETQGYLFKRIPGGGSNQTGVSVLGISPDGLAATSRIDQYMWAGEVDLTVQDSTGRFAQYGVVIGSYLADRLGAVLGSQIRIGFPPSELGTGRTPPMRRYIVTGIFNTGYAEFDTGLVLIAIEAAQRDLNMAARAHGYRIRLEDALEADDVGGAIDDRLADDLKVVPWMREHANLYASIQLEKWSFYLGLVLVVVIAGFNIVSILSMTVSERRRDIGILKAMGLSEHRIARVFCITGVRIGLSGIVIGTTVGVLACLVQILFEPLKLPGNVFIVNALPVELRVWDLVAIAGVALLLCYVFSLIPARDAARLRPVDAIRR